MKMNKDAKTLDTVRERERERDTHQKKKERL